MCDYPDCRNEARFINDGGLWCSFPHGSKPPNPAPTTHNPDAAALGESEAGS
jgi:hypothetical protein